MTAVHGEYGWEEQEVHMETAAVIVGIDDYANCPLSSAVNDALAFRQFLFDFDLVSVQNLKLLTSPGDPRSRPTKQALADTLYEFYDRGDSYDRFYFFYAGHGLLAYADATRSRVRNTLVPVDVQDLGHHGNLLLDLDELRERLLYNGPAEQFFFVDACRNLDYQAYPDVGGLGWAGGRPLGPVRKQATLFAVSPLGKAEGVRGGQGRMTTRLLEALRSNLTAVEYDTEHDGWGLTIQSVAQYVRGAIEQELASEPLYKRRYMLPQLDAPDPQPGALRTVKPVDSPTLVVHIAPEEAAANTQVVISLRGQRLDPDCLPPHRNHDAIPLTPQIHLLQATSSVGTPDPARKMVDLRREREVRITVTPPGVPGRDRAEPGPSVSRPQVEVAPFGVGALVGQPVGQLVAKALEPEVAIEIRALEPPYGTVIGSREVIAPVSSGPYRVQFRLGTRVFNETSVYVQSGETTTVTPQADVSPLVREALNLGRSTPKSVVPSESIGEMQAGILQTMLPILGVKPFDLENKLFRAFDGLVQPRDPNTMGLRTLSLVLAVDGDQWPVSPRQVLESVHCSSMQQSLNGDIRTIVPRLDFLSRPSLSGSQATGGSFGLERVALVVMEAPPNPFSIDFSSPYVGNFRLMSAAIPNRATVVTLTLTPDGDIEITQNLLRFPERDDLYREELRPHVSYGRMLRQLQLGQQLFASGELIPSLRHVEGGVELLYAKWTDPVLSCMAYLDLKRDTAERVSERAWILQETARNLKRFFGELPDSRVIYAEEFPEQRGEVLAELIADNSVPLLAENARRLARFAEEHGVAALPIVDIARRIPVGQIWSIIGQ
jgi:hypothetical protein